MDSSQVNVVKVENQDEFNWLYMEKHFERTLEVLRPPSTDSFHEHSINSFFEFEKHLFPYQNYNCTNIEFKDFEDLSTPDFCSWDDNLQSFCNETKIDNQPLNNMIECFDCFDHCDNVRTGLNDEVSTNVIESEFLSSSKHEEVKKQNGRMSTKSAMLELDEIQKHFDVPITKAAKEMKVGLTVLKRRCRELNITRWPHRKIKSLKSLINNVKELGLTKEIEMLEEHKRLLEKLPQMELTEKTKKLRQACFKANYKKRKSLAVLS